MAKNPNPSLLDPGQIIKRSFDESEDRIRVDAEITASIIGPQEVVISDVDDSIKIGNGGPGPYLKINSDGSINTTINTGPSALLNTNISYQEVSSVAAGVETTVLTFTAPAGGTYVLNRVDVSGSNIAEYKVKINGTTISKRRTWWTSFNTNFEYFVGNSNGYNVTSGNTITVTALHNASTLGDFNANLEGTLVS